HDTDQVPVVTTIALARAIAIGGIVRRVRGDRPLFLPAATTFGIYLWIPMVLIGTHIIFPRFGQPGVFGLLFVLPALPKRGLEMARRLALALAVVTALSPTRSEERPV